MRVTSEELAPFADMAMSSLHREYPYHFGLLLRGPEDLRPHTEQTPAFFGCFDWHSAVHGHWCLVRVLRSAQDPPFDRRAREALSHTLTRDRLAAEERFMAAPGREGFERPYGLAWVLQLAAELREWRDPDAARWHEALAPLEALAAKRLREWLQRLPHPVRSGEHAQSAFAMGLAFDWARTTRDDAMSALVATRAREFHADDRDAPVAYEPSGHDFLSPLLAEADLLRRVLPREAFATWLAAFLPDVESAAVRQWLEPVTPPDRSDGKLAHLDGLNLSRAWMLEGIASVLPVGNPHRERLLEAWDRHREAGLRGARSPHYAGTHWLGTFAIYLLTARGLA